ncbi:MAG TPA: adenylate/guanylate cyclase domain-containing protein [Candidatus Tectomicrobia bacterium]|nr:adenylate/guanylate cyclase domain-containing protein [Candidatus Tectomicrobia bacterium]
MMDFYQVLDQVLALLRSRGRVSYRALKRLFNLDDALLEDLKEELIYAQQVAVDEDGRVLVWTGRVDGPTAPPTESQHAPLSYTPQHLTEKIIASRLSLEGERKQVTVLFADLKGSLELLAERDPEEARQLLDSVVERMMEAVHRYEGTVNQVMGDGIMALFGAPIAHEDHAIRACLAALRMQEAVKAYAVEVQRTQGVPLHIRVGLNAGEVVVGSIASDLHMDYTAVGQTTHLAARMEQMAMPGSILITPDVLALVEGYVLVKALGPAKIKGLNTPLEVYEVTGAGPVRTRLQAAVGRGLTRFVGRDSELDQLRQALQRAGAGYGQVVAMVGEPGVGKSRLVYEFTRLHWTHGWLRLESRSLSYCTATPYLPVHDLLKAYFQIEARDDARKVREKVTGKLLTLDRALESTLPACLALLDVVVEDPHWHALEPPQRRQRTLEAVKRLLLRESQAQPLLLVFEDLHWIDSETQAFLDSLIDSLPTARLLMLINYRPEYRHGWGNKTYYTQLRLDPLSPASAEELLQAMLGEDVGLAPLKQLLIERTEGNPFFLEESVRALFDQGILVHQTGEASGQSPLLTKPLTEFKLPATVQAVLAARIDRLPLEEKRLLQTAAVIGTEVSFPLLQAIAELPEDVLHRGLAHLQAAEFLYETSLFPDLEYAFKHALTHEVAYGNLLQERRRILHVRIVEAIEQLYADQQAEQVERLAHHAFQGEMWDKAVAYLRQAGAKALARSAHREASLYLMLALVALQHLPERRDTYEQAIDLRFNLRTSLFHLGDFEPIFEHLHEAETLAEALGDRQRLALVYAFMSANFNVLGDHGRAVESGQRALAIAAPLGVPRLQVTANFQLGSAYHSLGDYPRARDVLRQNVESFETEQRAGQRDGPSLRSVVSCTWLVWSLAELGAFAEGIAHGERGIRIAEGVDRPDSLINAYTGIGFLYLRKGDLQRAVPLLERGFGLYQECHIPLLFPLVASTLGAAYALSGRISEALPLLEQAVAHASAMGEVDFQSHRLTCLAEAYLFAGRLDESLTAAMQALELSHHYRERGWQAHALRLLGDILGRREFPDVQAPEEHYRQALALAEELGMRPLIAHCHLGLGQLCLSMGKHQEARAELSAGMARYRSMEMTFWLPQAEAALEQVE